MRHLPPNRWRDVIRDPLPEGEMFFLLLSGATGTIWYVEEGPGPLSILRAREKVLREAGIDTRMVRCVTVAFDPNYARLK